MQNGRPSRWPDNAPLNLWPRVSTWFVAGGMLAVLYGLARDPVWVEQVYVEGFGGTVARWHTRISSWIPLSIGEVLLVLAILAELSWLAGGVTLILRARRSLANGLAAALLHAMDVALLGGLWFYLAWGVSYARPPAAERLGWEVDLAPDTPAEIAALDATTRLAILRVNRAYAEVHGSADAGRVTQVPPGLDVDAALDEGFALAAARLGLSASFAEARGPTKIPYLSTALSRLGISGVYVPFTGEATVNGGPPGWSRIGTAAHEKAHQRMIASEDEATFYGFLACVHSPHPVLRYAGWQIARRQLQRALVRADPSRREGLSRRLDPGPQQDLLAVSSYWQRYEGALHDAHTAVNDAYLKANRVEGGVASYAASARLIVAWLDQKDGRDALLDGRVPQ